MTNKISQHGKDESNNVFGKIRKTVKKKKKGKICWNRSIIFLWRQRFFQITSLSWFACMNEMWLYNGTKPWWGHIHDQASKRAEYLTLWALSVPCCRDAWGQTVMLKLPSSGSKRKESNQELLSSLQLWNVWQESSLHPLWFFKTVLLAEKGNFCSFLPSLCLAVMGSWRRKMCLENKE